MYTYTLILLFSLLSVLAAIFFTKDRFSYLKNIKNLSISTTFVAIPFLIWDHFFTKWAVWGFSDEYIMGVKFLELPIEEILFFFIIPFCSIYIYDIILNLFDNKIITSKKSYIIVGIFSSISIIFGLANLAKIYTSINFILLGLILTIGILVKFKYLNHFLLAFLFILIPFLIINGLLTSGLSTISENPVVWYDNTENLSLRVFTIPIEDFFYGFSLLFSNAFIFEKLRVRSDRINK